AGTVEVFGRHALECVLYRYSEFVDCKLCSFVESNDRAAFFGELLERVNAGLPEPAGKISRVAIPRKAVEDLLRALRGNDYAIVFRTQIIRADVSVQNCSVLRVELIEYPSSPALV